MRDIDQDQRQQRVVESGLAHHRDDGDRAQADWHHDADRQEQRQHGRAAEAVFGQGPRRHGAEQQNEAHAAERDDHRVGEIGAGM